MFIRRILKWIVEVPNNQKKPIADQIYGYIKLIALKLYDISNICWKFHDIRLFSVRAAIESAANPW